MALQPRNALILATPDAEILSLGRLGEHLAFKGRVAIAVLLATQTAFTVAQTELRAFGQSSSDTQQTEESIPKGKGLFWACSAPANCIRLTTTAVEKNKHTARNVAGGIAGSVFYKPQFSFEVSGERAMTRIPSAPISFFLKLHRGEMDEADAKFIDVDLVLVRARQTQNKRVVVRESYSSVTGDPSSRKEDEVAVTVIDLPDGAWTKVTTSAALPPGEYGIVFLPKKEQYDPRFVLDFGVDPAATSVTTP
jgi:hypothetical protein